MTTHHPTRRTLLRQGLRGALGLGAVAVTVAAVPLLSGCVTSAVFGREPFSNRPLSEFETVLAALLSQDGTMLAILTERNHYVFKTTPDFAVLLAPPPAQGRRPQLSLVAIRVGDFNAATCEYQLTPPEGSPDTQGGLGVLNGQRYAAGDLFVPKTDRPFDAPDRVRVETTLSPLAIAARLPMTPLTIPLDGAFTLGAMAMASVYLFLIEPFIDVYLLSHPPAQR